MSGKVVNDNIGRVRRLVTRYAEDTGLVRFDGEVNAYTQMKAVEAIVYKGDTPLYVAFTGAFLDDMDDTGIARALAVVLRDGLRALANGENHITRSSIVAARHESVADVAKRINDSLKKDGE